MTYAIGTFVNLLSNGMLRTLVTAGVPAAPSSVHAIESIMYNIKGVLETIINVGEAVADSGNSSPSSASRLSVISGGSFTGAEQTDYDVEVVTEGASGIAAVTVTDVTTGADSVVGNVAVTSGTAVDLGTRGGTITFTFQGAGALTIGDKWTVLCNVYNNTVRQVMRYKAAGNKLDVYPGIIIGEAPQDYGQAESAKYRNRLRVLLIAWMEEGDSDEIGTLLNSMLQDIETALSLDPQRGGTAQDTKFIHNDRDTPIEGLPVGALPMEIIVDYDQVL